MQSVDIIADLALGDSGKGALASWLCSVRNYDYVTFASAGGNKGHTIYHGGKKLVTHEVPCGVLHKVKSIIASGCVVHPQSFLKELKYLEDNGITWARSYIKIAYNAHIVTQNHIVEDQSKDKIGSTGRGIMPAYRSKYGRTGIRAEDIEELRPFVCDPQQYFFNSKKDTKILVEGAQGIGLCIDHGDYPYVTSSPPTAAYALHSLGLPPQAANEIWGITKCYLTYSGNKKFSREGQIMEKIQELGQEWGATTGRKRQVNWLDLDMLKRGIHINGVTHLVIKKMDILRELDTWVIRDEKLDKTYTFEKEDTFSDFIKEFAFSHGVKRVYFSDNPKGL